MSNVNKRAKQQRGEVNEGVNRGSQRNSFKRYEVEELVRALQLPEIVSADNLIIENSRTAPCMLLGHLAYPNQLSDLAMKFGWPVEHIS